MRDSLCQRKMPGRCVVGGCSNVPDVQKGIVLHTIPFWEDDRPETKNEEKRWVSFVNTKRAKWEPTKGSSICSQHFVPDDFQRKYLRMEGQEKAWIPRLIRDDFGVTAFPRIHAEKSRSDRKCMLKILHKLLCLQCCNSDYYHYKVMGSSR